MQYLAPQQFALIAHRGGSLEAPENTLPAFENAYEVYQEIYFELDTHESRDGKLIVIHDATVDRTTNGHGSVADLTLLELSKLDWGYNFSRDGGSSFPYRGKKISVLQVQDVLENFPKTRVTIEMKKGGPSFSHKIIETIKRANAQTRVCIAAEDHKLLRKTWDLCPDLCSGYSKRELFFNFIWNRLSLPHFGPHRGQVVQIPYIYNGHLIASKSFIHRAHRRKKPVHVWTINDEATMRHLIETGVDGVITDAPTLLLKVARDLKKI